MTLQVSSPYVHVEDANGNPYVAASLYVYLVGTTTKASIYSNEALSTPLSNPLTSDSAGNFPRAYIAAGTYKLRAETSAAVLIWTEDNIDTGLQAGTGALPISRGGTGATTAAAARAALDVPSNSELTALSTSITTLTAQIASVVAAPQGRLTLTSATPVLAADVTAGTSVFYTPYIGALIPIYNGTSDVITTFSELTLALNANHLANNIYDLFVINDASTIRLVTGPAWNTATAGGGVIGTGAGTSERVRVNGLWRNKNSMTARYGATTVSVGASQGTYVGSILMDGTNGQATCHVSYGQSRKWAIWNAYNRQRIVLLMVDPNASWSYSTNTVRQSRADATNTLAIFSGLAEEIVQLSFLQKVGDSSGSATQPSIGIGYNSTTIYSGARSTAYPSGAGGAAFSVRAEYDPIPFLGLNNVNALENGAVTGGVFYGTASAGLYDMTMKAIWNG